MTRAQPRRRPPLVPGELAVAKRDCNCWPSRDLVGPCGRLEDRDIVLVLGIDDVWVEAFVASATQVGWVCMTALEPW